jgi:hypothetical protein
VAARRSAPAVMAEWHPVCASARNACDACGPNAREKPLFENAPRFSIGNRGRETRESVQF